MPSHFVLTPEIRNAIQGSGITPDAILIKPGELEDYSRDSSELFFQPDMVVRAKQVRDIQLLLQIANQYHFPVVPRGAGSGLAGGCLADRGGVVLCTTALDRIRKIDTQNFIMEVEAGVVSIKVRDAAAEKGLFYPPDPAGMDQSTIGGNAATDAGGPACVKYGTTRDYILGLEAVLPDGTLIRTGVSTRKGVVGYDLTNLLVGSEGTLGIITALTLKLLPCPPAKSGCLVVFPNMSLAMNAVTTVMGKGYLPSAIEFMDHKCLSLVGDMLPFPLPEAGASLLIIEMDGPKEQVASDIKGVAAVTHELGATRFIPVPDAQEREKVWEVRRQVSLRIHDHAPLYLSEDIVVPLTAIAELVNVLPTYEETYGIEIFAFGHAGDGNIHLNITAPDRLHLDRVNAGVKALLELTLQLGGTISGEHGIGIAKRAFIDLELSRESLALQKNIKRLFDPNNILNPGKVFVE
jgi:D-lactate dehydrogenase (cytochrome)